MTTLTINGERFVPEAAVDAALDAAGYPLCDICGKRATTIEQQERTYRIEGCGEVDYTVPIFVCCGIYVGNWRTEEAETHAVHGLLLAAIRKAREAR